MTSAQCLAGYAARQALKLNLYAECLTGRTLSASRMWTWLDELSRLSLADKRNERLAFSRATDHMRQRVDVVVQH